MRKELIPIILLTFVNTLNFTILIPVLPFIVRDYGGGAIMYGILLSMYPIFQFFSAPALGSLSDKYGRRPLLLISQAGTTLSWVIFALAYFIPDIHVGVISIPLVVIMIARCADGATGGNNSVANAYLTDLTEPTERTKIFGMMGGVVGIGLIMGPVLGGITGSWGVGFLGPCLLALSISILTLILMYYFLPESLTEEHKQKDLHFSLKDELQFLPKIQKYLGDRRMKYLFFIRFFFLLVFGANGAIFVLYMIDKFGMSQQQIGYFFLLIGIFLIVNQVFVSRFIASRLGDLKTFLLGQVATIIALLGIMVAPNFWFFVPFIYLNNFGFSISFPTYRSLITRGVERSKQGEINGIDESIFAATSAIAPLIVGYIYAHIHNYTFGILSGVLFIALMTFVTRYKMKES